MQREGEEVALPVTIGEQPEQPQQQRSQRPTQPQQPNRPLPFP